MTKSEVKKKLLEKNKGELVELLLELYSAKKEYKEYMTYLLQPDEAAALKEYKFIIKEEFFPVVKRRANARFTVCRKAVADFRRLKPSDESMADLLVSYMEYATLFSDDYSLSESFYDALSRNFQKMLEFVVQKRLMKNFRPRILQCIENAKAASSCFYTSLDCIFDEYMEDLYEMGLESAEYDLCSKE